MAQTAAQKLATALASAGNAVKVFGQAIALPKYRGFMDYPAQQTNLLATVGCANQVEWAIWSSRRMVRDFGATAVVVVANTEPGSLCQMEDVVKAYIDSGLKVVLYLQGSCFFRGSVAENWTPADFEAYYANVLVQLTKFRANGNGIVGVILSEEINLFEYVNGVTPQTALSPYHTELTKRLKKWMPWPFIVIENGYTPYCQLFANLPEDSKPDVYMVETYETLIVDGKGVCGYPSKTKMLARVTTELTTADTILGEGITVGHMPLCGMQPLDLVVNQGWEFPYVPGYVRPQLSLYSGDWQLGWYWGQTNNFPYMGVVGGDGKYSVIGKELLGCWTV